MAFAKLQLLAALLLVTSVTAVPTLDNAPVRDADWLPRGGNFSVPKRYGMDVSKRSGECNLSLPKRSTDCKALSAREEDTPVKVKVYENSVMTFGEWYNMKKDEVIPLSPPTFTNLWNDVVAASCNDVECGEHLGKAKTPQHMGGIQGTLEMWLEGVFWDEATRDGLVDILRQAFDKAIVREYVENGWQMYEWGPKDLFVIRRSNQYSNDHLRMVLRTKSESEDGCGDIISRILELGGLVSPLFGLVSVACATNDM